KTLGSSTPRKPVLSVSARKIKDNAADWHNLILKWETLNDAGFVTANNIANLKISLASQDEVELEDSSPACGDNAGKMLPEYSPELEALCEELRATLDGLVRRAARRPLWPGTLGGGGTQSVCGAPATGRPVCPLDQQTLWDSFRSPEKWDGCVASPECPHARSSIRLLQQWATKIQMKMEKLSSTTRGICELENYHYGGESRRRPLFHTWPTAHFYEVSRKLADMYSRELRLKRTIVEELAHTEAHGLVLSYLSMWLHQPYVESDSKLQLEGLLLETGHRPL
ncbi:Cyclin-dependent kinase 2-interacting protein, partial [Galemys pyrenaicus]